MKIYNDCNTFNGRREVVYSLKKAAECAKQVEKEYLIASGPRPQFNNTVVVQNRAKMAAYFDVATYDKEFSLALQEMSEENISFFQKTLEPLKNFFASRKPFDLFKVGLRKSTEDSLIQNYCSSNLVEEFLDKIMV